MAWGRNGCGRGIHVAYSLFYFLIPAKLLDSSLLSFCSIFYLILVSILQVECILSILIYKNLTKGYFSHKSKVVVLSKQDPFPKLNGKPVNS